MALAATDVELVDDDFDIGDFDVSSQVLDLDLLAGDNDRVEFCGGGGGGGGACYSAIFSDADIVSHCRHGDGDRGAAAACGWLLAGRGDDDDGCGDGTEEEAGTSPAYSGVTDDGALALAARDVDDAEAMSAYVAELERFLLEDDDDDEQAEVDQSLLGVGVVNDYFDGDHLLATAEVVPAAGRAKPTDGEEEEENGDVLAAREDEQSTSRKRARNKIKGRPWRELELLNLMLMHLVPAAPWPPAACRMWPSGLIA